MSNKPDIYYKFENAEQSFKAFHEVYDFYFKRVDNLAWSEELNIKKIVRDSLIQRFECSVETCWKLLNQYLKEYCGIYENDSPKLTFKKSLKANLLTEEEIEIEIAIKMIDDRNLSVHTYKEETISDIAGRIPKYYKLIEKIISLVKTNVFQ